jgi:hypothetical protein
MEQYLTGPRLYRILLYEAKKYFQGDTPDNEFVGKISDAFPET